MVTAQQEADLRRQIGILEPGSRLTNNYINGLINILKANEETTTSGVVTTKTTVNNSSALVNIAGLVSGALAINSKYAVKLILRIGSVSATPGADLKFVGPAGSSFNWELGSAADVNDVENELATTEAVSTVIGIGIITVTGILSIGATAGTLQVQGAQTTPTVEDTDFEVDSMLVVTQVA